MLSEARRFLLAAGLVLLALTASYLPDLGHGFIRDDFAWIIGSHVEGVRGWLGLFSRDNGFYRPLVSASFALNERLCGLDPFWYAFTNFLLVVACGVAVYVLARSMGMSAGSALIAASIWALNPHGIGGAILWISGRTSLLLTLFAVLAGIAVLRGWTVIAAILALAALLSKEEAVLLPASLLALAVARSAATGRSMVDHRRIAVLAVTLGLSLIVYFALRARTAAYLPQSAPSFYRPIFEPAAIARNVLEYADRSSTLALVVVVLSFLVVRRWPALQAGERWWMGATAAWLICGFGLTVFLPVRSSLYAPFPSVGSALIAAILIAAMVRKSTPVQQRWLFGLAIVAVLGLVPLHRSRNVRLRKTAEFSTNVLDDVSGTTLALAAGRTLVLHDAVGIRYNLEKTFGTLIQDAVRLRTGVPSARVWVDPPPQGWEGSGLQPPAGEQAVHYWLRDGRLIPDQAVSTPSGR